MVKISMNFSSIGGWSISSGQTGLFTPVFPLKNKQKVKNPEIKIV
jgi:hypothetical protein